MPILVMAVVAFIIFLVLMGLVTSAVVSEQKKEKRDRLRSDIAALEATSPKSDEVSRSA